MQKDDMTFERIMVSALIGAVIGVVALLANHHIPKALNGGKE